jgi:poly(3-hydroxybutyrate) depolymerase
MLRCKKPALLAACALSMASLAAGAATREDFLYGVSNTGGTTLSFRYFVPPGYDAAQSYPLILFLHGAGERGNDNEAQLDNSANGAMRLLDDANLALQPVFMVAPQCFTNGWWGGAPLETAVAIVDQIAAEYSIDPARIYITGVSMGGMGTWSALGAHPDRFAAAVPMSGNGDTGAAASVAAVPFWFFHAQNDPTVGIAGSDDLVAALRNAGATAIYTRYDDGGHAIWPVAYAHPLLFRWLVSQRRGQPDASVPPNLRIVQPTDAPAWSTEDETLDLAGSADHGGLGIDAVNWSVLAGAGGTAAGTTSWSAAGIALDPGVNPVRVVASGPSGHADWGGSTSFNDGLRVTREGPPPEPGSVVAAINAGGAAYTAVDGTPYAADTAFDGGSTQVSAHAVAGTDDDALYNDWRWGNFSYHLPVPPGPYRVELQFADTYNAAPGQRIFDVSIEGTRVLDDFDVIAGAGVDTAVVRRFEVSVDDGVLDLAFANGSAGSARLDALRVIRGGTEAIFADGFEAD